MYTFFIYTTKSFPIRNYYIENDDQIVLSHTIDFTKKKNFNDVRKTLLCITTIYVPIYYYITIRTYTYTVYTTHY